MKGQGRGEGRCVCGYVGMCVCEGKTGKRGGGGKHSQLFFPFSLKSLTIQTAARVRMLEVDILSRCFDKMAF